MTTSSGSQQQQQQQQTISQPWKPAQPALNSILGSVQGLQGQSGINPTEAAAIQQLTSNAGSLPNFSPQAQQQASAFLGGDPFGLLNQSYSQYQNSLAPITNPANLNPMNTPGFSQALNTLNQDITNQIQGEFAGAGRTGSGMDIQTLARGLSQGEGSLLQNQYNQNIQNLLAAAGGLQGAGLNTSQAGSGNVTSGFNLASQIPALTNAPAASLLAAGQIPFALQAGNQGQLASIATPIAALGGQTNTVGQSNTNTTQSPSLLSSINQGILGAGLLFG